MNILPDGALDYDDALLEELDWVVASVHTSFRMSSQEMTQRIVHAMENPLVDAIGHLSGRKIEQRLPYEFDRDRVLEAAAATGTMLEINSNPDRRDINDTTARAAAAAGIPIVIDTDSHRTQGLRGRPLRDRHRPPGLAHGGRGGQHAAVGRAGETAAAASMKAAFAAAAALALAGCSTFSAQNPISPVRTRIDVVSPAFAAGGVIPSEFTCQGRDISPPLRLAGVPRHHA